MAKKAPIVLTTTFTFEEVKDLLTVIDAGLEEVFLNVANRDRVMAFRKQLRAVEIEGV